MNDIIRVAIPKLTRISQDDFNSYQLRKDRPHYWLQRLCVWTLDKLGCYRTYTEPSVEYLHVDCAELTKAIEEQMFAIRDIWNVRNLTIVIGRDYAARFRYEAIRPWEFELPKPITIAQSGERRGIPSMEYRYLGCRVVFVPYFDGFVVLPGEYKGQ